MATDAQQKNPYYSPKNSKFIAEIFQRWRTMGYEPTTLNASAFGCTPCTLWQKVRYGLIWLMDNTADDPETHKFWVDMNERIRVKQRIHEIGRAHV